MAGGADPVGTGADPVAGGADPVGTGAGAVAGGADPEPAGAGPEAGGADPEAGGLGPPDDPIAHFGNWLDDVVAAGLPEPTAMVLATAGSDGRPLARHVLLKQVDRRGFVWFTNYHSTKGRQLAENPWASLVFPWFAIGRQVVVSGQVAMLEPAESDAYFATRDRGAQLGAWASEQSRPIPDRAWLERRVAEFDQRFRGAVPRPPHWGGYRLDPHAIEFWRSGPARLHDRFRYQRSGAGGWRVERLSP